MAEGEPKKRPPTPIVAIIAVVVVVLAAVIWFTRPQSDNNAPPPELGPDTAQAAPESKVVTGPVSTASTEPVASPAAAGASDISFKDETLSFTAVMPAGSDNDPVVSRLRQDAQNHLAKLKANARADYNRQRQAGETPRPWEASIKWAYTAKAEDIVSLAGESSEYSGGAHPVQLFDTFIGRTTGEKIDMEDMMILKRSPSPAMTIAICEALKTAKTAKISAATIFDEPIVCAGPNANAKTEAAKLALAPSSQPDRFGGLYAYYEPYAVGAYVEGPYVLTVQQAVFAEDLKPEFKKLFAGEAPTL